MTSEVRSKIIAHLTKAKLKFEEGRTHNEGLPDCVLMDAENRLMAEGHEAIAVTSTHVQRYRIACPYNFSQWKPMGSARHYASPEDLVVAVKEESAGSKGCW